MFALFIVLNETDYLEDILAKFVETGVKGATILDSQGMASAILESSSRGLPLFSTFGSLLDNTHPYNKTIFSVLENEEVLKRAIDGVQEVMKEIRKSGAGFMFTVPIGNVYSLGIRD